MFRVRLKELREKFGYSQASFAEAFGTKQSTVGNWESGAREPNLTPCNDWLTFLGFLLTTFWAGMIQKRSKTMILWMMLNSHFLVTLILMMTYWKM